MERRDAFERDLHLNPAQRRSLSDQFRIQRKTLEVLVSDTNSRKHSLIPEGVWAAFDNRSVTLAGSIRRLIALQRKAPQSVSLADLAMSYVHMHINRMMRSHAPRQEAVVYDFLCRIYSTIAAKSETDESLSK